MTIQQLQQQPIISGDKYIKIKKRLKETIELNETLSKEFIRAKKKIKTLTFERNLLLDRLSHISNKDGHSSSSSSSSSSSEQDISAKEQDIDNEIDTPFSTISKKSSSHHHHLHHHQLPQKRRRVIPTPPITTTDKMTTVASAPPKRSKINRINIKTRRVQPIERDETGHPKLPQQIGVLTVLNLGKIKSSIESFHNERYIFPIGYTVRRTYQSMIDPTRNTMVTSTILDGGDGPRFHVSAADQPNEPIVANSATGAWTVVVRKSNEIRHREHSNSASGPDYYGFKHPTIAKMIQDLPGTKLLKNYVWQDFEEMEPKAAKGVMAAAEKKRDNLEHMRNAVKVLDEESTAIRMDSSEDEIDELEAE